MYIYLYYIYVLLFIYHIYIQSSIQSIKGFTSWAIIPHWNSPTCFTLNMFSGFLLCVAPIDFYHENAWLKHLVERPQLHDWLIALSSHKASAKCLEHLTTFQLTGCEEAPKNREMMEFVTGTPFFFGDCIRRKLSWIKWWKLKLFFLGGEASKLWKPNILNLYWTGFNPCKSRSVFNFQNRPL